MLILEPGSVVAGLRVERELGRGAFGVVYLAADDLIGRQVALKLITTIGADSDTQNRALREARAVGRLKSPNIVTLYRVHPMEDDDTGWMLEMEFVEGGSLTALLAQEPKLPLAQALAIVRGILNALHVAHEAGVVHGDVKPANVLMESTGQVKLADFGLSWMMDDQTLAESMSAGPVGTPIYMAPEVIMGARGQVAADLWSTGIVFYRMLCGEMPFRTANLRELFISVQNAEPQPLPVSVPAWAQALVLQMLEKSPDKRPASAAAVLEELNRARSDAPVPTLPVPTLPAAPAAPRIFGRDEELSALNARLDQLEEGKGAAILLDGEAGVGKTALVQTLAAEAHRRGMLAMTAVVTSMEGTLRPLLRTTDRMAPLQSSSEMPPRMIQDLLAGKIDESLNTRQQIAWAVEQLFIGMSAKQPVVLIIEDAQEADPEDLKLFGELARRFENAPVLMVLTYRTHHLGSSGSDSGATAGFHALASLTTMQHISLGPLGSNAVFKLLEHHSEVARIDADIAQRVIDLSEGNPLFAVELMRHLEQEGAIILDGSSVRASPSWDGPSLPARFHDLVAARLAGLTDEQRAILDVAAVDGREFDGEALEAALDRPLLGLLRELQALYRDHHLIEPHGDGYQFTSSVVREVIYDETAPALRRAIHRQLAEHLEQRADEVDPARLGLHWERARQLDKARPHLMAAAAEAAHRLEHRRLVAFCERAGMVPGKMTAADALKYLDTLLGLVWAYEGSGAGHERWEAMADALETAARDAGDEQAESRIAVSRAWEHANRVGYNEADEQAFLHAVDVLELRTERGNAKYKLGLQAKLAGNLAEAKRWLELADEDYLALGAIGHHGQVLNQLGTVAWRADELQQAQDLFAESARIAESVGRRINACASVVNRAMVRFELGELDGLVETLERAVHTLTLEGSAMAPIAAIMLSDAFYAQGDLDKATRTADAAFDMIRDSSYLAAMESVRGQQSDFAAVRGRLKEAREHNDHARRIAESRDHLAGRVRSACQDARLQCFLGDLHAASAAARTACELAERSQDASASEALGDLLPEAILYGLPPDAVRPAVDNEWTTALLAFADPAARIEVPKTLPGHRRAVFEIMSGLLSAERAQRDNETGRAQEIAGEALAKAEALGHVWLEACALRRVHEYTGDKDYAERCHALVWRIADGLDTANEKRRLLDVWAALPGSTDE